MSTQDTKERILDAAEALFAENGFSATSLRAITAEAEVNLASVNYHFGSKESLIEAVFDRRLEPLKEERLRRLEECARREDPLEVEAILRAFMLPPFRMMSVVGRESARFMTLISRAFMDPGSHPERFYHRYFEEVATKTHELLLRALPDLPPDEIWWRIHFMIGTMSHTLGATMRLEILSDGREDITDFAAMLERLVTFLSAGMRSPVPDIPKEVSPA